ncbi:hypothetical protein FOA52_014381 [Chlamydomonas sp. UWO 241]|nr:hypothetical protein FOA52_014381 [Chlamydomonas sp. UWO 241]
MVAELTDEVANRGSGLVALAAEVAFLREALAVVEVQGRAAVTQVRQECDDVRNQLRVAKARAAEAEARAVEKAADAEALRSEVEAMRSLLARSNACGEQVAQQQQWVQKKLSWGAPAGGSSLPMADPWFGVGTSAGAASCAPKAEAGGPCRPIDNIGSAGTSQGSQHGGARKLSKLSSALSGQQPSAGRAAAPAAAASVPAVSPAAAAAAPSGRASRGGQHAASASAAGEATAADAPASPGGSSRGGAAPGPSAAAPGPSGSIRGGAGAGAGDSARGGGRAGRGERGSGGSNGDGVGYKYREVVRKKDERAALPGFSCAECAEFFAADASWAKNLQGTGIVQLPMDMMMKSMGMKCTHTGGASSSRFPAGGGGGHNAAAPAQQQQKHQPQPQQPKQQRAPEGPQQRQARPPGSGSGDSRRGDGGTARPHATRGGQSHQGGGGGDRGGEAAAAIQRAVQEHSKHRGKFGIPSTPEGFWQMGFDDSQDSRCGDGGSQGAAGGVPGPVPACSW